MVATGQSITHLTHLNLIIQQEDINMKPKELGEKYGVTAMQVGKLRKKFFPDHKGGELNEEEIDVIANYLEDLDDIETRKDMEEAVKPQIVEGFVSYAKKGKRLVECKIRRDGEIVTVRALVPMKTDPSRILFKRIPLEVIEYKDKHYYRHASLANVAWPKEMIN